MLCIKRVQIELQGDDLEEMFEIDDCDFDEEDKSRLDMLENYRNDLIAGVREQESFNDIDVHL